MKQTNEIIYKYTGQYKINKQKYWDYLWQYTGQYTHMHGHTHTQYYTILSKLAHKQYISLHNIKLSQFNKL